MNDNNDNREIFISNEPGQPQPMQNSDIPPAAPVNYYNPMNNYDPERMYIEARQRLKDERRRIKDEEKRASREQKRNLKLNRAKLGLGKIITIGVVCAVIGGILSSLGTLALYSAGTNLYGENFLGIAPGRIIEKVSIVNKYDSSITAIADKVSKSVVGIRVTSQGPASVLGNQAETGEGSGIIYKSDGYIITNFHVIEASLDNTGKQSKTAKIEVVLPTQTEKLYPASIVGYDWMTDLAVIKINARDLPVAEFDNSDKIKVGELAVAIGNPGGLEFMGSVSVGYVSGLNRTIELENSVSMKLIQTDAAINPGNSGGALVNYLGKLIGVNSAKLVSTEFEGMGFAIPSNTVIKICDDLIQNKYVKGRPFIGITRDIDFTPEVAQQNGLPAGVLVDSVSPAGPAYKAGIQRGDIIIKFNGVRTETFDALNTEKNKFKPGDTVKITIFRGNKEQELTLILSEANG